MDSIKRMGSIDDEVMIEPEDKPVQEDGALLIQIDLAIEKIYGAARPALNVVDVAEVPNRKDETHGTNGMERLP